jgi:hypothetical protein
LILDFLRVKERLRDAEITQKNNLIGKITHQRSPLHIGTKRLLARAAVMVEMAGQQTK